MTWGMFLSLYAISLVTFLVIDLLWLGVLAKRFYRKRLGDMVEFNWIAAFLFYFLYVFGLAVCVSGSLEFSIYSRFSLFAPLWSTALMAGACYGFFTYLTYDLTNKATLKGWRWDVTLVDIAWGTFLGGAVAAVSVTILELIFV